METAAENSRKDTGRTMPCPTMPCPTMPCPTMPCPTVSCPAKPCTAPVNRVIPFSSVDGPGNRTAVFLQGCNWDCCYCHNPETRNICIGCGDCAAVCPRQALTPARQSGAPVEFHPERCILCDSCIKSCTHGSSPRICCWTAAETFERVKRQIPFIRGVTVSGGECCLYPQFLRELFELCKEAGLSTMIDSNGSVPLWELPELLEATDGVMLDIKAFDREEHRRVTAADNGTTLKNAVYLAERGRLFEVRTVVVPGLFDIRQTIRETGRLLAPYQVQKSIRYKLIAYRPVGVRRKYQIYESPQPEYLAWLESLAREVGFTDIVVI